MSQSPRRRHSFTNASLAFHWPVRLRGSMIHKLIRGSQCGSAFRARCSALCWRLVLTGLRSFMQEFSGKLDIQLVSTRHAVDLD
jgi:hypothetical protein